MSIMEIIGITMLAAPFAGLFVYSWSQAGFWSTVAIYALLGLLFGWIYLGVYLLEASG